MHCNITYDSYIKISMILRLKLLDIESVAPAFATAINAEKYRHILNPSHLKKFLKTYTVVVDSNASNKRGTVSIKEKLVSVTYKTQFYDVRIPLSGLWLLICS